MAFNPFDLFSLRKRSTKIILATMAVAAMFLFVIGDVLIGRQSGGGSGLANRFRRWFSTEDNIATIEGQNVGPDQLRELHGQRLAAREFLGKVVQTGQNAIYADAGLNAEDARMGQMLKENPFLMFQLRQLPLAEQMRYQQMLQKYEEFEKNRPDDVKALQESRNALCFQLPFEGLSPEDLVDFTIWQKKADDLGIVVSPDKVKEDLLKAGAGRVKEEDLGKLATEAKIRGEYDTDTLLKAVGEELRVMMAKGYVLGTRERGSTPLSLQVTPWDLWNAYTKIKTQLQVDMVTIPVDRQEFLAEVAVPSKDDKEKWDAFVQKELKPFYEQYKDKEPNPDSATPGFKVPEQYRIEFVYADLKSQTTKSDYYRGASENLIAGLDAVTFLQKAVGPIGAAPLAGLGVVNPVSYLNHEIYARYDRDRERKYSVDEAFVLIREGKGEEAILYRALPSLQPEMTVAKAQRQTELQFALGLVGQGALPGSLVPATLLPEPQKLAKEAQKQKEAEFALASLLGLGSSIAGMGSDFPTALPYPSAPRLVTSHSYEPVERRIAGITDELTGEQTRRMLEADFDSLERDLDTYSRLYQEEERKWKRHVRNLEGSGQTPPPFVPPAFKTPFGFLGLITYPPGYTPQHYLKAFAAPRGITYEGMKELRDKEHLFKEKDATPLGSILRSLIQELTFKKHTTLKPEDLDRELKSELTGARSVFEPRRAAALAAPPEPFVLPEEKDPRYAIFWKAEAKEAHVPKFDDPWPDYAGEQPSPKAGETPKVVLVSDKVLEAWKFDKARAIAQKRAEELVALIEKKLQTSTLDDIARELKDLNAKPVDHKAPVEKNEYVFTPDQILSRYRAPELASPLVPFVNYTPAKPPVMDRPLPTDKLMDDLLPRLNHPGDAMWVSNNPKTQYYVLVLRNRKEPKATDAKSLALFDQEVMIPDRSKQMHVTDPSLTRGQPLPLANYVLAERERDFVKNWQEKLRQQAHYNEENAKKLAEYLRERGRE